MTLKIIEFFSYTLHLGSHTDMLSTYFSDLNRITSKHAPVVDIVTIEYLPPKRYVLHYGSKHIMCETFDNLTISTPIFIFGVCLVCASMIMVGNLILSNIDPNYQTSLIKKCFYSSIIVIFCSWLALIITAMSITHHRIYFEHGILPILNRRIVNWIQQMQLNGGVKTQFNKDTLFDNILKPVTHILLPQNWHYEIFHRCQILDI